MELKPVNGYLIIEELNIKAQGNKFVVAHADEGLFKLGRILYAGQTDAEFLNKEVVFHTNSNNDAGWGCGKLGLEFNNSYWVVPYNNIICVVDRKDNDEPEQTEGS